MSEGCLTVQGLILIWPAGYSLDTNFDPPVVFAPSGLSVVRVGEPATLVGGERDARSRSMIEEELSAPLPESCQGAFWIVSEAENPPLPTPTAQPATGVELSVQGAGTDYLITPELMSGVVTIEGDCLVVLPSYQHNATNRFTPIWPAGTTLDASASPPRLLDAAGRVRLVLNQPAVYSAIMSINLHSVDIYHRPSCPGPFAVIAEVGTDDAAALAAAEYAVVEDISLTEALRRIQTHAELEDLDATLKAHEPETYAGSYVRIDHAYRIVFLFTENGEEILAPYVRHVTSPFMINVEDAQFNYQELVDAERALAGILDQAGVDADYAINVEANRVELHVPDTAAFDATLQALSLTLPVQVHVNQIEE